MLTFKPGNKIFVKLKSGELEATEEELKSLAEMVSRIFKVSAYEYTLQANERYIARFN